MKKYFHMIFSRVFEQWISMNILGIIVFVTTVSWSWINDLLFSPPYDYVYVIEREPNPLKRPQEKMELFMQELLIEMGPNVDEKDKKAVATTSKAMGKIIGKIYGEINSDQMRVWIINLRRRPLDNVSFTFQDCTGYVRLEADPLAAGPTDGATPNPDISSNGAVYRYGKIMPKSQVYVKAGFKNIHDCTVAINAQRNGAELATSKLVTPDEWKSYYDTLRSGRDKYASYLIAGIGGTVGVLLVLLSLVYRSISLRLAKLEKRPSGPRRAQ